MKAIAQGKVMGMKIEKSVFTQWMIDKSNHKRIKCSKEKNMPPYRGINLDNALGW
jgi:hypothetical protein